MSDDDDYTQAIDTPTEADDTPGASHDSFESGGPSMPQRVRIPRGTDADRAAMSEAIAKFAAERAAKPPEEEDELPFGGDYDEKPTPRPQRKPVPEQAVQSAATPAVPPAPSLDPEVQRMREHMAQERDAARKAREDAEKARDSVATVADYETYLESAPKAYRGWMEAMRGSAMTDEEFKQEAADFVTMMSSDVLGVQLPDGVKAAIESKLGRKALAAYKQKEQRTRERETAAQETARVAREWKDAETVLDRQFAVEETAKAYPWLAAEESPGFIVVDVIKSAQRRDGTVLSWQEASKQANDYLKKKVSGAFDRRKHLLSAAPANPGDPARPVSAQQARPPGPSQVARQPEPDAPSAPRSAQRGWDKEAHRRQTRAAFAATFKPEE